MKKYLKFKLKRGEIFTHYWEKIFVSKGFTNIQQTLKKDPRIKILYRHECKYEVGGKKGKEKTFLIGFKYEL